MPKRRRRLLVSTEPLEPRRLLTRYVYVDAGSPGPTHNGTSWSAAYTSLQTALLNSTSGDQIRVATGTYKPTTSTSRTATFSLKSGVSLSGGYAGHTYPAFPDAHNPSLYPTLLSGDIGTPGDPSDNSYHVLYSAVSIAFPGTTTVDGFTITAGNANSTAAAYQSEGGGLLCTGNGQGPQLTNCIFTANSALSGGAIALDHGEASISQCTFLSNTSLPASSAGGGVIYIAGNSSSYFTNNQFRANSSATAGGAIYTASISTATTFQQNLFIANSASTSGGVLYSTASSIVFDNCTLAANLAPTANSIYAAASSAVRLNNCIDWDAGSSPVATSSSSVLAFYTDFPIASPPNVSMGSGNIHADPLFLRTPSPGPDNVWFTSDDDFGDLHLQLTSPAIDAGSNDYSTPSATDLDGSPREIDIPSIPDTGSGTSPIVDLGVYEAHSARTWYVDQSATGSNDGSSWAASFTDLQSALAAAGPTDTILVAAGTYKPTSSSDRNATFSLKNNVQILGSYAGHANPANPNERSSSLYPTVLSGDIGTPNDPSDNSYHVVTSTGNDATAILDGFTITAGNADASNGGGLYAPSGYPSIRNCTFINNSATKGGGAYYSPSAFPVLLDCAFLHNTATGTGTGQGGGGLALDLAPGPVTVTIINCSFVANSANLGGGLSAFGLNGDPFGYSTTNVINCTFTANTVRTPANGAALAVSGNQTTLNLTNSICYADIGSSETYGSPTTTYSDIQNSPSGTGNLSADPLFTRSPSKGPDNVWGTPDDDFGNLRPQSTSPVIDRGNNQAIPTPYPPLLVSPITTDLAGSLRQRDIPSVPDAGLGSAPIVDLGAYEAALDLTATAPAGPLYLILTPDHSTLNLFSSSTPTGTPFATYPARSLSSLTLNLPPGSSPLTLDFSNGPLPNLILSAGSGADSLTLANLPAATDLTIQSTRIVAGPTTITTSSLESILLTSTTSLHSLGLSTPLTLSPNQTLRLSSLTLAPGGSLDLANNTLLLQYPSAPDVNPGLLSTRQSLQSHQLFSSTADSDPRHLLTLGYLDNSANNTLTIKSTLIGDANLDGRINADDYALTDRGLAKHLSTWSAGDFNYDGSVTSADLQLLEQSDAATNSPSAPAAVTAAIIPPPVVPPTPIVSPATPIYQAKPVITSKNGKTVTVSVKITNLTKKSSLGTTKLRLYFSTNAILDAKDRLSLTKTISLKLKPKSASVFNLTVKIPPSFAGKSWHLLATAIPTFKKSVTVR